jgi:hypothetical protein
LLLWVLGGSTLVFLVLELKVSGHKGLELLVSIFPLQLVSRELHHIKEALLVSRGHLGSQLLLGFRLAKQLPKRVLLQPPLLVPLVIRLGLLGRVKCPVLRLAFRVAIDSTRYNLFHSNASGTIIDLSSLISFSICIICYLVILLYSFLIISPCILVWHLLVVVRSRGFAFGWILNLCWCRSIAEGFLLLTFTVRCF